MIEYSAIYLNSQVSISINSVWLDMQLNYVTDLDQIFTTALLMGLPGMLLYTYHASGMLIFWQPFCGIFLSA